MSLLESAVDDPAERLVEVWSVDLGGDIPPRVGGAALDPAERRRAERMAGPRRREFLRSHAAARMLLAARLGCDQGSLQWGVGAAGKPGPARAGRGRSVHWNLSHTADRALVAVADAAPVGVDLVHVAELHEPDRIAERYFAPRERRAVRDARPDLRGLVCATFLSRKEACVKALGIRLLEGIGIDTSDTGAAIDCAGSCLRVRDLAARPGWARAVALHADAPFMTVEHVWHWPGPEEVN